MGNGYVPTRVRYFGGMYLCVDEFEAEQTYHRYARELLNSGIFTPGIVDGLAVTFDHDALPTRATITPGRALDDRGRLMVLADDAQIELDGLVGGQSYSIVIKYAESNDDPPGDKATRTVEKPHVDFVARPPVDGEVLLASFSLVNGRIAVDSAWGSQGTRRHAGAILGSIEFPLEPVTVPHLLLPPDPTPISIAARGYAKGDSPVLELTAPYIALSGNVSTSGSLSVDQLIAKDLTVTEEATVDGPLSVDGPLNVTEGAVTDTLVVGGGGLASGAVLTVTGASSLNGSTTVNGPLTVTDAVKAGGAVTASAGLSVTDGATADTLVVGGGVVLTSGSAMTISGSADISDDLTVTGTITAGALSVNGALNADNLTVKDITVTAQATIDAPLLVDGKLTVSDGATTNTLVVGGGSLSPGSALTVNGVSALIGNATISGALAVSETVTAAGKVTANGGVATSALVAGGGTATFGAVLTINGDSALNGNAAISGAVTVTGTVKATGKVTADAGASVKGGAATDTLVVGGGALTSGSTLTVNGDSSLNANATVQGSLTVQGPLTVNNTVAASTVSATNISSKGFKVTNGSLNCINFEFHSVPVSIPASLITGGGLWDGGEFGPYDQDAVVTISLASDSLDRWNEIPTSGDYSSSYYVTIDNSGSKMIHAPVIAYMHNWSNDWAIMAAPMTFVLSGGSTFNLHMNWVWDWFVSFSGGAFELRINKFGGPGA